LDSFENVCDSNVSAFRSGGQPTYGSAKDDGNSKPDMSNNKADVSALFTLKIWIGRIEDVGFKLCWTRIASYKMIDFDAMAK
jgi:hypothetical protein